MNDIHQEAARARNLYSSLLNNSHAPPSQSPSHATSNNIFQYNSAATTGLMGNGGGPPPTHLHPAHYLSAYYQSQYSGAPSSPFLVPTSPAGLSPATRSPYSYGMDLSAIYAHNAMMNASMHHPSLAAHQAALHANSSSRISSPPAHSSPDVSPKEVSPLFGSAHHHAMANAAAASRMSPVPSRSISPTTISSPNHGLAHQARANSGASSRVSSPPSSHSSSISPTAVTSPTSVSAPESPSTLQYPICFRKGSLIQLADGALRKVEEMQTQDFLACTKYSPDLIVDTIVIAKLEESNKSCSVFITFEVGKSEWTVEAPLEHPFYVYQRGWSSFSPERSRARYGLDCHKLKAGDTCISLKKKPKESPMVSSISKDAQSFAKSYEGSGVSPTRSNGRSLVGMHHAKESEKHRHADREIAPKNLSKGANKRAGEGDGRNASASHLRRHSLPE